MTKHILFSVAGETPQVVTETLWGLWKERRVTGGEVYVLTTTKGKEHMQVLLPGKGDQVNKFNAEYRADEIQWEIKEKSIEVLKDKAGNPLEDLYEPDHNNIAADRIVELVQEWTGQDEITLHASMAGGRKTMGVFLTQAMSWFARPQDTLSHVIVKKEIENDQKFFYPRRGNMYEQGLVHFAPQPFIQMRGLLPNVLSKTLPTKTKSYSELVTVSQLYAMDSFGEPIERRLNIPGRVLILGDNILTIRLSPMDTAVYWFLCEKANAFNDQNPFYFKDSFKRRDELIDYLRRADVEPDYGVKHGLGLLVGKEHFCPPEWASEDGTGENGKSFPDLRKSALDSVFNNLKDKVNLWPNTSIEVRGISEKGPEGPRRYVYLPKIDIITT